MRYRPRSPASRDAAAERRADAERAAGVPDRPGDTRGAWLVDIDAPGVSIHWICEPRRGYTTYRARAVDGSVVVVGTPKTILKHAASLMPRVQRREE